MTGTISLPEVGAYAHRFGCTLVPVSDLDLAVLRALSRAWGKIHDQDDHVPESVVFDLTPGRSSSCVSVGWDQLNPVIELNLRPEGQNGRNLTAAEALEFLLHQAAHSIAGPVRSSEGRWHPAAYQKAAESIGLHAESDPTGYGATSLGPGARTRYRSELTALDRALAKWEPTEQVKSERASRNGVVLECSCTPETLPDATSWPRKIRLRGNPEKINIGGIWCRICNSEFKLAT